MCRAVLPAFFMLGEGALYGALAANNIDISPYVLGATRRYADTRHSYQAQWYQVGAWWLVRHLTRKPVSHFDNLSRRALATRILRRRAICPKSAA